MSSTERRVGVLLPVAVLLLAACRGDGPVTVSIDAPANGATVQSPVTVKASAKGLQIERAGLVRSGAGHFHLLVDMPCDPPGQIVAATQQRLRLEDGRARIDVTLPPGDHTLCLQAADGRHIALVPTDKITIHVVSTSSGR